MHLWLGTPSPSQTFISKLQFLFSGAITTWYGECYLLVFGSVSAWSCLLGGSWSDRDLQLCLIFWVSWNWLLLILWLLTPMNLKTQFVTFSSSQGHWLSLVHWELVRDPGSHLVWRCLYVIPFAGSRGALQVASLQAVCTEHIQTDKPAKHLAFEAPELRSLICRALYNLASDLEGAKW